ncbi:hypothetical protein [Halopiger xanaduensis]|uniref:Uncharacterized protein n=1 Tax=Halopiger xanaduensis (strain DSM 18323 / JCM 14033 / SH-6) TaxID=797210 RepID=F8DC04_HALXS|nr:hypothetical protein [Halopiger xanaduensis]AEH35981.1 hypothetical protein Halxa_1348 [Halopiger xanaduensis SH-6]
MSDRSEGPSGPLDVPTLEVLARRGSSHPLVAAWAFRPDSISPRVLELELDRTQYPGTVASVRVDVRWFTGGDYTVHYLESRETGAWQCRWDRHPKPDAPREHFHPPPDAAPTVEPSPLDGTHHLEVLFGALEWIGERVAELHDA